MHAVRLGKMVAEMKTNDDRLLLRGLDKPDAGATLVAWKHPRVVRPRRAGLIPSLRAAVTRANPGQTGCCGDLACCLLWALPCILYFRPHQSG